MKRLKHFEYCGDGLFPYIKKALDLLHPEKKEAFLNDESVQVISSEAPERGFQITFKKQFKSIIYINAYQIIKQCVKKNGNTKEDCFIYGIAHEMGHYFAGKGESYLLEKEANDWLKKWGDFDELIQKIHHTEPISEEEGYTYGYNWANTWPKDGLWEVFYPFLILWDKKDLHVKKETEIIDQLKSKVKPYLVLDEENYDESYLKGISLGIMKKVREIADKH